MLNPIRFLRLTHRTRRRPGTVRLYFVTEVVMMAEFPDGHLQEIARVRDPQETRLRV